MRFETLAWLSSLLLVLVPAGCDTRYVRELDEKPAFQLGLGGWARYDGIGEFAGDFEVGYADYHHPENPSIIRMVGVIHIADAGYYQRVQQVLEECDVVLYEGIRRGDRTPPQADPNTKRFWAAVSSLLNLKAQVNHIDYDREKWRQVDLATVGRPEDPNEIQGTLSGAALEAISGLSELEEVLGALVDLPRLKDGIKHRYAQSLVMTQVDAFESLSAEIRRWRQRVAEFRLLFDLDWLKEAETAMEALESEMKSIAEFLINERNLYVVETLDKDLDRLGEESNQESPQTIGVFYGAAHMPDLDARLGERGWRRREMHYLRAWSINSPELKILSANNVEFPKPSKSASTGQELIGNSFPISKLANTIVPAPESTLKDNEPPRLTLVRWWTDGCPFCENTLPAIEELRRTYGAKGLKTVAVYHPKPEREISDSRIRQWAMDEGYHGLLARDLSWDLLKETWLSSGQRKTTNVTFLVDALGRIRFIHPGPEYFPSSSPVHQDSHKQFVEIRKAIEFLLSESRAI